MEAWDDLDEGEYLLKKRGDTRLRSQTQKRGHRIAAHRRRKVGHRRRVGQLGKVERFSGILCERVPNGFRIDDRRRLREPNDLMFGELSRVPMQAPEQRQ